MGGAGVSAFAGAKKFRFEQVFGNRTAIDCDKGACRAVAAAMHGARYQFLAGTRFPAYQHRCHTPGHFDNARFHRPHHGRFADQLLQHDRCMGRIARACSTRCCARHCDAGLALGHCQAHVSGFLDGRRHDTAKLLEIDRLGEVVKGPGLERLDRILGRAVGGDHHAAFRALLCRQVAQQFKPQAVGQAHVGDDGIKALQLELLTGLQQVTGSFYPVALPEQRQLVQSAQIRLVINDQDAGGQGGVWRVHGFRQVRRQDWKRRCS